MDNKTARSRRRVILSVDEWKRIANCILRLMDTLPSDEDLKKVRPLEECARWCIVVDEVGELGRLVERITQRAVNSDMEELRTRALGRGEPPAS